jgi:subtilisin family serine protease
VWNNPFDPADGVDNDGNGYVDDAHGWDFYSDDTSVYDAGGDNHGTHVAGTIAASGGNARGVVGVNWNATIISTKFLGAGGGYTSDDIGRDRSD